MAGEEDWRQTKIGLGENYVWVHIPCGSLVASDLTSNHSKNCDAS